MKKLAIAILVGASSMAVLAQGGFNGEPTPGAISMAAPQADKAPQFNQDRLPPQPNEQARKNMPPMQGKMNGNPAPMNAHNAPIAKMGEPMPIHVLKIGGFTPQKLSKVSEQAKWQDDQAVILQGKIVKQVGKKDFLFRDATGEIEVEIGRQAWHGESIGPDDEIKIIADVEKSWGKTEVEVLHIKKIPQNKDKNNAKKVETKSAN